MFDPVLRVRNAGGNGISEQNVLEELQAMFAVERAAILTKECVHFPTPPASTGNGVFDALGDPEVAASLESRWQSIRAEDCRAYKVTDCETRLDGGMRRLMQIALDKKQPPAVMNEAAPAA